jgi:hypothetical protein
MSLDYSKLSDEELDAIANDDYSKLSDRTLRQLTRDPSAAQPTEPSISVAPQAASMAGRVAALAPEAMSTGANLVKQGAGAAANFVGNRPLMQTVGDIAGVATHGVPWGSIAKQALDPNAATVRDTLRTAGQVASQGAGMVGRGAANVGRALVTGAVAPESAFLMPYQMAAYEQDKIRANPNAPGLEYNPYAQVQRGEFATQGQAGAANQRRAVINQPFGNVTPAERSLLEEDQQRKLRLMMQVQAAKKVLGQQ